MRQDGDKSKWGHNNPPDKLEGRDGTKLKEWLNENKHVTKVTRDRAGAYAKVISEALPEAMQIADRFHLHQNLLTAVKEALKTAIPNEIEIPNNYGMNENPAPKNESMLTDCAKDDADTAKKPEYIENKESSEKKQKKTMN